MARPSESSLEMIRKLISFDTTSRNSNLGLIEYVRDYLADLGASCELIYDETGQKANLYATLGPADRPGIALSGHTDVVPVDGQEWQTDPWEIVEKDGKLYGRGTCDMKSFVAVALAKAPIFAKADLKTPVHFCFSYDEEVGCLGVRPLLARLAELPVRPALVVVGEPTDMKVINAHKGKISVTCSVRGFESHSSLAPTGVNAVEYAARLVVKLQEMARRKEAEGPFDRDFDVPHTTVHTGTIQGGTALNIVPKDCSFEFEFRNLPTEDYGPLYDEVVVYAREVLEPEMQARRPGTGFSFEEMSTIAPMDTPGEHPVVALAKALTGANATSKVAFGTEAGLFNEAAIPSVVCGPGSIEQAHKPNEFIALEQVALCERFMDRLTERLVAERLSAA
ncbi:acetylornithine deacetylase [Algihabitans albus]|uniref:acetylornithine deacetylase n=1 Tax=Algihabitans albus TaxID=2164067 RepID=UPI000E5DA657|nr:acetylornithine deacetylase [Algihabitans albus]